MKYAKKPSPSVKLCFMMTLATGLLALPLPAQANGSNVQATQQVSTVRGTVVDQSGSPLIGVSILVKGTTTGTVTDFDGNFVLDVAKGKTLEISYVGYLTQSVVVSGSSIHVVMKEDALNLEELVVVGYGLQKKANLTGSVANVDNKLLDNRPLTNLSSGLAGLLPGVSVLQNSGQPGLDVGTINIRGIGTFNESGPLVIIDGFEGTMNDVNPNDVESISVLKDAASSAIYGSKAANGVILITTKRGKTGRAAVTYQGLVGVTKATDYPRFMSSDRMAEVWNIANQSVGVGDRFTQEEIAKFRNGTDPDNYANTDWQGLLYKTGLQTSHNVTLSGGSESAKYLASVGYLYQNGIVRNYDKNQFSARINVDINPFEKLETSWSINFMRQDVNEPLPSYNLSTSGGASGGEFGSSNSVYQIFRQINVISPMVPYKYQDGSYGSISDGNPIAWVESGANGNTLKNNLQAIGSAKYYFIPSLSLKAAVAYTRNTNDYAAHNLRVKYHSGSQGVTEVAFTSSNYERSVLDITPEWVQSFGGHNFDVLAGYHAELYKYRYNRTYRTDMANDVLTDINAGSSSTAQAEGYTRELAMISWFGRIAYNYKGRYLFEANARYDGSSRFSKDNRWGFFPSFSAGWRFSDERFWNRLRDVVSNAKLRLSWGKLGNQEIGSYYPTITQMSLGYGTIFDGKYVNGTVTRNAVNKDLKWEATKTVGIGLDFKIWKLNAVLDWYEKTTTGILMTVDVPAAYALSNYYDNIGKVRNRGFEFGITYDDHHGDWSWGAGINGCFNNNNVLNLGNDVNGNPVEYRSADVDQSTVRNVVGKPMNQYYGYEVDGFLKAGEEKPHAGGGWADYEGSSVRRVGDLKFVDQNGDGQINGDDRTYLGSMDPKFTFGFHLNGSWKGIDVVAFFQGALGGKRYMGDALGALGTSDVKLNTLWEDSYILKGEGAKYPNLGVPGQNYSGNTGQNSFWLQNASYCRLKELQIGYTIPQQVTRKIGISNCRVFYSGQNLLTVSGMIKGFDPESPSGRGNGFPPTAVNSFGLNVTF